MDPDSIPRLKLVERAEKWLAGIRERPLMYGGSWGGVEVAILDALDEREFGLSWPHEPPGNIGGRWCAAICKVYRDTNGTLADALAYDGIRDPDAIHSKYREAIDDFLACDGLYTGIASGMKLAEVAKWKVIFARGRSLQVPEAPDPA